MQQSVLEEELISGGDFGDDWVATHNTEGSSAGFVNNDELPTISGEGLVCQNFTSMAQLHFPVIVLHTPWYARIAEAKVHPENKHPAGDGDVEEAIPDIDDIPDINDLEVAAEDDEACP